MSSRGRTRIEFTGEHCANRIRALLSTDMDSSVYENPVYDDIPCLQGSVYLGLCSLDGATPVPFPTTPTSVIVNFTLAPRPDAIFTSGFDP